MNKHIEGIERTLNILTEIYMNSVKKLFVDSVKTQLKDDLANVLYELDENIISREELLDVYIEVIKELRDNL